MAEVKAGKQESNKGIKHPDDNATITGPRWDYENWTPSQHGKGTPKKRG